MPGVPHLLTGPKEALGSESREQEELPAQVSVLDFLSTWRGRVPQSLVPQLPMAQGSASPPQSSRSELRLFLPQGSFPFLAACALRDREPRRCMDQTQNIETFLLHCQTSVLPAKETLIPF